MKPNTQRGWGLTETLLTLGAISVMGLATYAVLGPASASAQVKREQDNLRHLSTAVDRSFGLLGSFSGVSTQRVLQDGLAPTKMRQGDDLRTAWGTGIGVHPYAVGHPDDAFLVTYPLAPAEVCAGLAAAMARDAFDIRVEGRTVYADGVLDPVIAAEQCGQGSTASMEFVFYSGLVSGQAVAAPPLILPPAPPSTSAPPATPPVMDISDNPDVGDASPGDMPNPPADSATPPPAPPPVAPPPAAPAPEPVVINTPPPVPVTPPGVICDPAPTPLPNQTQRVDCPTGYLGDVYEARTHTQHYTCPEAWDNPQPSHRTYGLWVETSNTCAPECAAPPTETETRTLDCPSGQLGEILESRTTTWTCPAQTGAPESSTSSWAVVSNTCTAECVAPPATSEAITRAAPVQTRDACPDGYVGSTPQRRTGTEAGTRRTSWTCPAETGSPTSSTSDTWSGTYNYGSWTANGPDTCAAPCVAPPSETETRTRNCPAGQVGEIRESRTITWSCPSSTGAPKSSTSSWAAVSNTCATQCVAPPATSEAITRPAPVQNRDACPDGYVGSTPQRRTGTEAGTRRTSWTCPAATGSPTSSTSDTWSGTYNYGGWTANGPDTCAAPCVAPPSTSTNITRPASNETRTVDCPAGQEGTHAQRRTRQERGTRTTSWTCPAATGSPTSSTSDTWSGTYNYGSWTTTSNTCAPVAPTTCAATYAAVVAANESWMTVGGSSPVVRGVPGALTAGHPFASGSMCIATTINGWTTGFEIGQTSIYWACPACISP